MNIHSPGASSTGSLLQSRLRLSKQRIPHLGPTIRAALINDGQTLINQKSVMKFVTHSRYVLSIARRYGWLPGARYTNLRDVRSYRQLGFLDIEWRSYDFERHIRAAKIARPIMTVARDVEHKRYLPRILDQAHELAEYCEYVVIVPKDRRMADDLEVVIPPKFLLGYSVPSRYGGTQLPPCAFRRPTHLLGGRPDLQRRLAELIPVVSFDCNRFTLDASFGDYFDGETFRPHPVGGYEACLVESIRNINALWKTYNIAEVNGLEK